jgi:isovaleryl-CoA dehydrogenase
MNTGYPTLNFGLGEEIDMLRDAVSQLCEKEIRPRAADIDRDNDFPADLWPKFGGDGPARDHRGRGLRR